VTSVRWLFWAYLILLVVGLAYFTALGLAQR
jgi:hypothetical protein